MRVLEILDQYRIGIADIEVELNGELRHSPTLCAISEDRVIPLNTPDGRPIFLTLDYAIKPETK